jgi:succinylglutamate desuccinylase
MRSGYIQYHCKYRSRHRKLWMLQIDKISPMKSKIVRMGGWINSRSFRRKLYKNRPKTIIQSTIQGLEETMQHRSQNDTAVYNNTVMGSGAANNIPINRFNEYQRIMPNEEPMISSNYSLKPIESIAIVGGTHGNEYTGIWIVREIEELTKQHHDSSQNHELSTTLTKSTTQCADATTTNFQTLYPSLSKPESSPIEITSLIGNPIAHQQNRRFINVDLNRQFSYQTLSSSHPHNMATDHASDNLEVRRAYEINQLLGPKTFYPTTTTNDSTSDDDTGNKNNMDLVIDLHSTTAAMDCTLIVTEGDILMIQAAAYVMHRCNEHYSSTLSSFPISSNHVTKQHQFDHVANSFNDFQTKIRFETRILIDHVRSCHSTRPFLPSIGKHEFTIEVGPVPQGVLRHDAVLKTKIALYYLMEFISLYNDNNVMNNDTMNEIKGTTDVHHKIREMYPIDTIPCFTDLGRIPWPSHPENPNFPLWIVHESIQDRTCSIVCVFYMSRPHCCMLMCSTNLGCY